MVSDKLVAGPNETLEPGTDERYYCLDCYKEHHDREPGAHFEYETANELWAILEAADGRLVADAKPMTVGGRGWFRVVDGDLEARHSVMVEGDENDDWDIGFEGDENDDWDIGFEGDENDDWDIGFETELTPDFGEEDFYEFFGGDIFIIDGKIICLPSDCMVSDLR